MRSMDICWQWKGIIPERVNKINLSDEEALGKKILRITKSIRQIVQKESARRAATLPLTVGSRPRVETIEETKNQSNTTDYTSDA